jgi:photosystem II stability/assembly factor-like uncharacterized protein
MGATGGGVWKSTDAGITWRPISDRYFKTGSVGSIAVADSDPNIIYVGMGEACLRSNISHGDGVYKSADAGRTWHNIGLRDTSQIGKVLIDPRDADLVYVAAIGHPYGPNPERGVFRSSDGGQTWQKILFIDDKTGAVDLAFDPRDSHTVYAATWQVLRRPWDIAEYGPGSGIYKSSDGGDHWVKLTEGLPKSDMGKIGLAVSPVDPDRVWATIGSDTGGGVYRSDDAGKTWRLLNGSFEMHARQYYYAHIFADPQQRDTVYTFSSKDFYKSTDGGTTWGHIQTPHGDYHDLWIDPHDEQRMVNGNDGGATVTFDGGQSWSSEMNQATAQFYTVRTDSAFPYNIYGAQQDNTTVSISSEAAAGGRGGPSAGVAAGFMEVGGGESGYVVPDIKDPDIVYAGAFWGLLTRYDRRTGIARNIAIWPDLPGGRTAAQLKYRFQWTFPIAVTPADPGVVYAGANVVFKSTNQGQSWTPISGDLTRNDKSRETARLEDIYCTVFSIAPSPADKNTIWAGSDDGLIHVTRNGGRSWTDVTPKEVEPWTRINVIEASPHDPLTAYVAATRYQMDDFRPYIYRTHDGGRNWTRTVAGIPEDTFVRTVRQDPVHPQLLFAGTETGVYVSFDDGDHWQSLQLNLPVVPVTDLTLRDGDLVASTQGRAFWVLDDISALEQWSRDTSADRARLFSPRAAYRVPAGRGAGASGGVIVDYYLPSAPAQPITLEFEQADGAPIKSFSSVSSTDGAAQAGRRGGFGAGAVRTTLTVNTGLNRFVWDMRYPDARGIEGGTYFLGGSLRGPQTAPGRYKVKLTVGDQSFTQDFEIKIDPRVNTSLEDYSKQVEFELAVRDRLSAADDAINEIHRLQHRVAEVSGKTSDGAFTEAAQKLAQGLDTIQDEMYEPRFTGFDDQTLIYPLKINNRLAALLSSTQGDYPPTDQQLEVFGELRAELDRSLASLKQVLNTELPGLNAKLKELGSAPIESGSGGR